MKRKLLFWYRVLKEAVFNFNRDDGWAVASHVALSSIFALFPFLIFATSVAGFLKLSGFNNTVMAILFDYWPKGVREPLMREVQTILTVPRSDALTFGGLLTLYFASNGVEALRVALNRSYRQFEKRPYWWLRLQGALFVFLSIFVLIAITLLLVLLPLVWRIATGWSDAIVPWGETVWFWRFTIAITVLFLSLVMSHVYLPAGQRRVESVLPGVFFTLICWTLGSIGFGAYLERFADYVSIYAGLAGVMIGLFFLYLIGVIFILGAEINAAFTKHSMRQLR